MKSIKKALIQKNYTGIGLIKNTIKKKLKERMNSEIPKFDELDMQILKCSDEPSAFISPSKLPLSSPIKQGMFTV